MKTASKKIITAGAVALSLALANAPRANAQMGAPQSSSPDSVNRSAPSDNGTNRYERNSAGENSLARVDRASCVIGMAVRNQNNERLGEIKDVVFDLKSERVAYAVMAASGTGVLGMHEKLLAVPLNAFTPSADDKYLILRADKAKVEAAAGIDRYAWPSAVNPSWGAQPFWQSDNTYPYQNNGAKSQQPDATKSAYPNNRGAAQHFDTQGGQISGPNAQGNDRNNQDGVDNSTTQPQDNSAVQPNPETHPRSN